MREPKYLIDCNKLQIQTLNIVTSTDLHLGLIPLRSLTFHWHFSLDIPFARVSLWRFLWGSKSQHVSFTHRKLGQAVFSNWYCSFVAFCCKRITEIYLPKTFTDFFRQCLSFTFQNICVVDWLFEVCWLRMFDTYLPPVQVYPWCCLSLPSPA